MKTIVFIQNTDFPKQWTVDIFYYTKYLSRYKDIQVKVIVSKISENIIQDNIEIIELWKMNYLLFIIKSFFIIKRINKSNNIDYVYFFALHPFSVILQFFVKYLLNIKTIYDVVSWPIGNWLISYIAKITIQLWVFFSDKFVILDRWLIEKVGLLNNKNFEIVPMWFDEEIFNENKNINLFNKCKNDIIFTYIGTLDKQRNLDILLNAFIEQIKINNNIKLYFIWFWNSEKELKNISNEYINKNIYFLWKVNHNKIPDYINSSDILISFVPKIDYFEHQPPTKLIEYLSCNKPVMCTNTIAQKDILKWFKYLIHEDNHENTKNKIWYIVKNIEKIKLNNFTDLVNNLSWKKLVNKLYILINK